MTRSGDGEKKGAGGRGPGAGKRKSGGKPPFLTARLGDLSGFWARRRLTNHQSLNAER